MPLPVYGRADLVIEHILQLFEEALALFVSQTDKRLSVRQLRSKSELFFFGGCDIETLQA